MNLYFNDTLDYAVFAMLLCYSWVGVYLSVSAQRQVSRNQLDVKRYFDFCWE